MTTAASRGSDPCPRRRGSCSASRSSNRNEGWTRGRPRSSRRMTWRTPADGDGRPCGSCTGQPGVPGQQRVDVRVALDGALFEFAEHQFAARLRPAVRDARSADPGTSELRGRPTAANGGSAPASRLRYGRARGRSRACSSPPRSAARAPAPRPSGSPSMAASASRSCSRSAAVPGRRRRRPSPAPGRATPVGGAVRGDARSRWRCARSGRATRGSCCPAAAACSRKRGSPASARRKTCAVRSSAACGRAARRARSCTPGQRTSDRAPRRRADRVEPHPRRCGRRRD